MSNSRNESTVNINFSLNVNIAAGFIVGLAASIGFHPIDRAFYLRNVDKFKNRQHLFSSKYWQNPWQGLRNTFYQRILSNGIYFTLQGEFKTHLFPKLKNEWQLNDSVATFIVGLATGTATGFFSNASYAVKFYTISRGKGKPLENAILMWNAGGYRPFTNGIYAGVSRDAIFGCFYELSNLLLDRHIIKPLKENISTENTVSNFSLDFSARLLAASIATTMASPFNYARNVQFNTPPNKKQPLTIDIWVKAWNECNAIIKKQKAEVISQLGEQDVKKVSTNALSFPRVIFFQKKFMIGAGTIRAAGGMAVQQMFFNHMQNKIRQLDTDQPNKNNSIDRLKP